MFSLPLISFFSFFTLLGRDGSPTATLQRRPRRNFLDSRFLGVAREVRKEIFGKTNSARDQTNVATVLYRRVYSLFFHDNTVLKTGEV